MRRSLIGWIDPQLVIVVAARRALDRDEVLAAIVGTVHGRIADVDHVGVARVDGDAAEIPATLPDSTVAADARPARSAIVGAVQAAVHGIDQRKHPLRLRRRDRDADATGRFRQAMAGHGGPGLTAVARLV